MCNIVKFSLLILSLTGVLFLGIAPTANAIEYTQLKRPAEDYFYYSVARKSYNSPSPANAIGSRLPYPYYPEVLGKTMSDINAENPELSTNNFIDILILVEVTSGFDLDPIFDPANADFRGYWIPSMNFDYNYGFTNIDENSLPRYHGPANLPNIAFPTALFFEFSLAPGEFLPYSLTIPTTNSFNYGSEFVISYGIAKTNPVPEPGTVLLVSLGLVGLRLVRRKFKR